MACRSLHTASSSSQLETVADLIRAGADLDEQTPDGSFTPLHLAVYHGNDKVVATLIRAGCNVDLPDTAGFTPVHTAVLKGRTAILRQLVKAGANLNTHCCMGNTPLLAAISQRRIAAFKALIEAQVDVNQCCSDVSASASPLFAATLGGDQEFVKRLVEAGASINFQQPNNGLTALHAAALTGNAKLVNYLVGVGAEAGLANFQGITAANMADMRGDHRVAARLNLADTEPTVSDSDPADHAEEPTTESLPGDKGLEELREFSVTLSNAMCAAGFKALNASLQSGAALVLQDILRRYYGTEDLYVFGSFSDGWGSCLRTLNGRISRDSDIDVTVFQPEAPLCLRAMDSAFFADCNNCRHLEVEYVDGHARYGIDASGPNAALLANYPLITAIDLIKALRCCRYPRIELLQPDYRNRKCQTTEMPQRILQQLRDEALGDSPKCHAVVAAPPDEPPGSCMRVSTTLLERAVMHSLTTVQGQFFILLKFLIKKVISSRVSGLKTYMAKNLLFYMLDETPAADWEPQNLLELVRQSLQLLVEMMESSDSEHVCMKHFFLRDANVYFKKDHDLQSVIIDCVQATSRKLLVVTKDFKDSLRDNTSNVIQFHPFYYAAQLIRSVGTTHSGYFSILPLVKDCIVRLGSGFTESTKEQQLEDLLHQINKLPEPSAKTTKECLKFLAYLKFGVPLNSSNVSLASSASPGIPCAIGCRSQDVDERKLTAESAKQMVWSHLSSNDSAWKFGLLLRRDIRLDFLPSDLTDLITKKTGGVSVDASYYFLDFSALCEALKALYLDSLGVPAACAPLMRSGMSDFYEVDLLPQDQGTAAAGGVAPAPLPDLSVQFGALKMPDSWALTDDNEDLRHYIRDVQGILTDAFAANPSALCQFAEAAQQVPEIVEFVQRGFLPADSTTSADVADQLEEDDLD